MPTPKKKKAPIRYLSRPEIAARLGLAPDTLNRYKLPEHDAQIGARQRGWLPETIDAWDAARPGKGWRKQEDQPDE
jgi:predicted DNA-binding transcriptional regulator AlpA